MAPKDTLLLVDGNNLLFRSFYAMPPLTARDGRPNGALHGFTNILKMLLREEAPTAAAAVFDAPGPTFRDAMFPEYKAQRPKTPEALAPQMPLARDVARALGVLPVEVPEVEADDVIGSLGVRGRDAGYRVLVVSGDKDLLQVVGEGITVLSPSRTERTGAVSRLDAAGVRAKLGIAPEQVPDYLGLIGDSSDNIPGVPGVGPKTAVNLLDALGDLEGVLARAAEVARPRIVKLLAEHAATARLSRDLATLRLDVGGVPALADLAVAEIDREAARELFESLDLRTHARDLAPRRDPEALPAVTEAQTAEDVERLLAGGSAPLAVHADFAAPEDRRPPRLRALGLARSADEAMLVELDRVGQDALLPVLAAGLERLAILGHGAQGFVRWLIQQGVPAPRVVHDSEVAIWLLETTRRAKDFPAVLRDCTGLGIPEEDAQPGLFAAPTSHPVLAIHAAWQHRLARELESRLAAQGPRLQAIFAEMEMPLVPVLARMEEAGVALDPAPLKALGQELGERIETLTRRIHELSGGPFDLQSPKQLAQVLFDKLMLTPGKKTQRLRQASTRAEVLEQLALEHEVPRLVLEYRELAKLKNTYVDPLPDLIAPPTGRLHTRLHQTGAATGRLSSSDPNLQNIPIRTELGRRVRRAFVAPPGRRLIAADYSQIELRALAHMSEDPGLIEAFQRGEDIHARTAETVFGELGLPAAEARRRAKIINFSIIYGKTAFTLGREIGVSTGEAAAFIEAWFERYAGVRELIGRILEDARKTGRVETLFGRQRHIPDIGVQHRQRRLAAERMAVNAPIQGTAADLIKFAMIRVDRTLRETSARLLLQIHDELLVEADEGEAAEIGETVRREMEAAAELRVPLAAQVTVAPFWEH